MLLSKIRKRLTYTNVAVTLTFLFAMSGGALAASKYLITSTKQISPKVLKALKGKNGKDGSPGSAGAAGPAGPKGEAGQTGKEGLEGKEGKEGPGGKEGKEGKEGKTGFTETLPSKKTETGAWAVKAGMESVDGAVTVSISFPIPLAKELGEQEVHYIASTPTAECPGTPVKPEAEPGNLCVYQQTGSNSETAATFLAVNPSKLGAATSGAIMFLERKEATKEIYAWGSWAVTAP